MTEVFGERVSFFPRLIEMREYSVLFLRMGILKNLVLRNLKIRYKGSVLGFAWGFLNPFLSMLVLYVVFSQIVRIQIQQYPLFLLTGLFPWVSFSNSLTEATRSIIDNANLVKKIYFPRDILPISYVLSNFINLLFGLMVLLFVLVIFRAPSLRFLYFLPIIIIIHLIFTVGLALLVSCGNVYIRDISHILNVALMFWFYLTPVFYPVSMVPPKFHTVYMLNPMVSIISMYRNILFEGNLPSGMNIIIMLLVAMGMLVFGLFVFKRYASSFAKEV
jgi:ABC-2 type transport system permease protein